MNQTMNKRSTRDGFGRALEQLVKEDSNVVFLSGDLNDSLRMEWARKISPNKFIQSGIAEQNMVAMSAGLSLAGLTPFVGTFGAFMLRATDQIRVSVALSNLNVKFASSHCGLTVGQDGANAQVLEDLALFQALPNFTILTPADFNEAFEATLYAQKINGPVYIRLSREEVNDVSESPYDFTKASILRQGSDVAILTYGNLVNQSLQAAKILMEKESISVKVVNYHCLKPFDEESLIQTAKECNALVIVEEHQKFGGLASKTCQVLAENYNCPVEIVAVEDKFGQSGKAEELLNKYGLTTPNIIRAIKTAIARK